MELPGDLADLPFVDEHHVLIDASPSAVWRTVARSIQLRPAIVGRVMATVLRTDSRHSVGDSSTVGATVPGFTVVEAVPNQRLVLSGRHRFSQYALAFVLTEKGARTQLAALTYARFPGVTGRAYRALVIGSRGHRVIVTNWLRTIRRAAEGRS